MTPSQMAVDVQVADEEDVRAAIDLVLSDAGVALSDLRAQAAVGRFSSEECRLAWFAISSFVEHGATA